MNATGRATKAVIFDLDGTLIDSAPDIAAAVNRYLEGVGRPPLLPDHVARFVGNGPDRLLRDILLDLGLDADDATVRNATETYLSAYNRMPANQTTFFHYVREDLDALRRTGYKLGICTNKPHLLTQRILGLLKIDHLFAVAIGADAVARCKPDPMHLDAVIEAMGFGRGDVVYVGDSEVDRETAQGAGVPFYAVSWGGGADVMVDDHFRLGRLADLTRHVSMGS